MHLQIADLINANSELQEIEDELAKLHEQRSGAEKSLAELVEERQVKEEEIRKVESEIEQTKARNNAKFHSMVFKIFTKFMQVFFKLQIYPKFLFDKFKFILLSFRIQQFTMNMRD